MPWNAAFVTSDVRNWKKALDKVKNVCTIFMNLSIAFDSINHVCKSVWLFRKCVKVDV